jgi:hypothetical protein
LAAFFECLFLAWKKSGGKPPHFTWGRVTISAIRIRGAELFELLAAKRVAVWAVRREGVRIAGVGLVWKRA